MTAEMSQAFRPGVKVIVTQQIAARDHTWTNIVRGTIVRFDQRATGSWYAHSKNDKLWLDRLELRKDDGELITLNLDDYSKVEIVGDAPASPEAAPAAPATE